jgi:ArsR family transcriptional regulator
MDMRMSLEKHHQPNKLSPIFKALSDPTRLRLLNLLCEGEVCVCFLSEALKLVQPTVSRHLAYLKRAGLVSARREGQWIHYGWARLKDPTARALMEALRDGMTKDEESRRERKKLKRICCR